MDAQNPRDLPRIPALETDYRPVRLLFRSHGSTEFLARERVTDRLVRIRIVPAHPTGARGARPPDPTLAVARLDHPGIAVLLGTRRLEDHGWALIFQQPPGSTLEDRLREGAIPAREAERILRGLGAALAHAHARGVVHGNLDSSMIHLDPGTGQPRLTGFGGDRRDPTEGPTPVDDVRALGEIGWKILTGEARRGLVPLAERCPGVPRRIRAAVEGAIDPEGTRGISDASTFVLVLGGDEPEDPPRPSAKTDGAGPAPSPPAANRTTYRHPPRGRAPRARSRLRRAWSTLEVPLLALLVSGAAFVALHPAPAEVLDSALARIPVEGPWSRDDSDPAGRVNHALEGSGSAEEWAGSSAIPPGGESSGSGPDARWDEPAPEAPGDVVVVGGRSRIGAPGRPLHGPVVLRVVDEFGVGIAGVDVMFGVASGGGHVDPERAVTGPGGAVSVSWTLGPDEGTQVMIAEVEGTDSRLAARVTAEAASGTEAEGTLPATEEAGTPDEPDAADDGGREIDGPRPASIEAIGPGAREIAADAGPTTPLEVRVLGPDGEPASGVTVRFRVTAGGGSASPDLQATDDEGTARAIWRLGSDETQSAEAVVEEFPSLSIEFSARAGTVRLPVQPGIRAGGTHSCSLDPDGRSRCWGANESGQLGDGSDGRRTTPGPPVDATFARVVTGVAHSCGITASGEARCWGLNDSGQLGDGTTTARSSPVSVPADAGFTEIALGASHTCALASDGAVHCWGSNEAGQLGDGSRTARSAPVRTGPAPAFRHVVAGWRHTCALDRDGAAFCWGANESGQAGVVGGTHSDRPRPVLGGHRFTSLAAGNAHTCGVTEQERVLCWGANDSGQLGDGTTRSRPTPAAVADEGPFGEVTAGGIHSCGRTPGGELRCWGGNLYGQLGDGSTTDRSRPVPVADGHRFAAVHALGSHTCGRTQEGRLLCWGYNLEGQVGDGTRENRVVPTPVRR